MSKILELILAVLATFRLARIVSKDTIFEQVRAEFGKAAAGKKKYSLNWYLAEWINCQLCTGVWFAAFFAGLLGARRKKFILYWLSIAGAQSLIALLIGGLYNDN